MNALVIAGGIPKPGDPLYQYSQGKPKALIDIAGKPMVQWVLDALSGSAFIEHVTIIGIGDEHQLLCSKPTTYLPNQGGLLDNVRMGVNHIAEEQPEIKKVAIVSADIPAITSDIVDWAINTASESDHDLYYNIVRREVMEARFPGSNRSFVHLKNGDFCGGDMNIVRVSTVTQNETFWNELLIARKNAFKQASLIGFDILFMLLIRRLSLESGVEKICKRLGINGRAIDCPYAELAMDVDKPHQLELLREDLTSKVPA